MFLANNIYSSYYWLERNTEAIGLVIDVSFDDDVVDAFNESLTCDQICFNLIQQTISVFLNMKPLNLKQFWMSKEAFLDIDIF